MSNSFYAQNREDLKITEYFGDFKGNLLSIGENNGFHLSNCLKLIENGWSGVLVEPAVTAFKELEERHKGNKKVINFNVAISDYVGESEFYESGVHLGINDTSLLSTLKESELKRWEGSSNEFKKTKCTVWDFKKLQQEVIALSGNSKYDFISLDAEGLDLQILSQMDLIELGCKAIIVEHNGITDVLSEIKSICASFGLINQLLINAENIILTV